MSGTSGRLGGEQAIRQEQRDIQWTPGGGAGMLDPGIAARLHALCLSGGGIRSAAFCVGVVQALAKSRKLRDFHYLSTVSGGGYTGAMIWRLINSLGSVAQAETALAQPNSGTFNWLRGIRDYTSYLAPRAGFASLDVWAAVAMYVRNTLVNFCIFLPALVGCALLPRLWLRLAEQPDMSATGVDILLAIALAFLLWSTVWACLWVPVHAVADDRALHRLPPIARRIALPAVLGWAFPIALCYTWSSRLTAWSIGPFAGKAAIPAAAGIVMVTGYVLAGLCAALRPRRVPRAGLFWTWNLAGWLVAVAIDVGVLWLGAWLVGLIPSPTARLMVLAILGPAWVVMAHLLHAAAYAVCRQETASAWLDREWIARLSATEILSGAGWVVLAAVCLVLPHQLAVQAGDRTRIVAAVSALFSGPLAALLGRSANTALDSNAVKGMLRRRLPNLLAAAATVVFLLSLLILGSAGGWRAVAWITAGASRHSCELAWSSPGRSCSPALLGLAIGAAGLLLVSWCLGGWINVNRYSLHEMYRNRLARAFLGSARATREADGFTNLDENDRIALTALTTPAGPPTGGRRLFPVINIAMNLTRGTRTAWAERKAASFTMTPLHCGSAALGDVGVFVPTGDYGGTPFAPTAGVQLDTAMTISGAAVSPNAGYHSSAATSFIMTLFNARLGAWMPNPARASLEAMRISKPRNGFLALLAEMLGWTDDRRAAAFLSDGGHFENLGLYEMLRRRCAVILVVDADCDPQYRYFDLGNAIRKARIDLGVEITFFPDEQPVAGSAPATPIKRAEIRYPATNTLAESLGILLYLKAHLRPGMPADVIAYAAEHAEFPHETTGNQFFTESQFESYRRLGEFLAS